MTLKDPRTWIRIGDAAEGLVVAGRIVGIVCSENTGPVSADDPERGDAYELWWIPVAEPGEREVLFGVGDRAPDAWASRWERGKAAGERLYAEMVGESSIG